VQGAFEVYKDYGAIELWFIVVPYKQGPTRTARWPLQIHSCLAEKGQAMENFKSNQIWTWRHKKRLK